MLTYHERKARLSFGAQADVADECGVSRSWVTLVMRGGYRDRTVETALAKRMAPRTSVTAAFGPPKAGHMRERRGKAGAAA